VTVTKEMVTDTFLQPLFILVLHFHWLFNYVFCNRPFIHFWVKRCYRFFWRYLLCVHINKLYSMDCN